MPVISDHPSPSSSGNVTFERCQTLVWHGPQETETVLVQFLLFVVCGSTLLIKYFIFEKPRRPCCTWFWDASKQGWGAALAHGLNLLFSSILTDNTSGATDPCAWYFINISVDTFIGVFFIFILIEYAERFAKSKKIESLSRSGDYGDPPRWDWWLKQFILYCFIVSISKCITFIGVYVLREQLNEFGQWVWSPLRGKPLTELLLVMIITPALMNAWVFWVTDTFIMLMSDKSAERYPTWCCFCCNKCKNITNCVVSRTNRVSSVESSYGALNGNGEDGDERPSFSGFANSKYMPPDIHEDL